MNLSKILESLQFIEDRHSKEHLRARDLCKITLFADCSGFLTIGDKDIASFNSEKELEEVLKGDY